MKHQIMDKIVKEMENIGQLPRAIIKYGTIASVLLFVGASLTYAVNNYYLNDYILMHNTLSLMKVSANIFAEVIIGGLIIDHLIKSYQYK